VPAMLPRPELPVKGIDAPGRSRNVPAAVWHPDPDDRRVLVGPGRHPDGKRPRAGADPHRPKRLSLLQDRLQTGLSLGFCCGRGRVMAVPACWQASPAAGGQFGDHPVELRLRLGELPEAKINVLPQSVRQADGDDGSTARFVLTDRRK
jgi:hypothetical protein